MSAPANKRSAMAASLAHPTPDLTPHRAGSGASGGIMAYFRLMRPHQWVKNAFVAAPLFFTPEMLSLDMVWLVFLGVVSFSFVSSAVYVLNDYMDREADRRHPVKKNRPIASGEVAAPAALGLLTALLITGFVIGYRINPNFALIAGLYFVVNVAYSMWLKQMSIVDVMTITFGFILRVFAGAAIIGVQPSVWIVMCTGLVALFLALAKRRDDVVKSVGTEHRAALNGYTKPFLDAAIGVVLGALLIAYVMYATDADVSARLGTDYLYMTAPFVLAGILRYLQIALVEERSGAPSVVVMRDRFLIGCIGLWAVTFATLIYV